MIDRLLRRLPQSTLLWSCPWFLTIVALCALGFAAGLADGSTVGLIVAGLCVAFALEQAVARERGGPGCHT